jgi:hypothetical protein
VFEHVDAQSLDDPAFSMDAVDRLIVIPLLAGLGYGADGRDRVIDSKPLQNPYINVGATKFPLRTTPMYTVLVDDKPVLVIDVRGPRESVLKGANVQQVYGYAIHPEIQCQHFALCNGKTLVVFSVDRTEPVLVVYFAELESRWAEIERWLAPRFWREPVPCRFLPDLGSAFRRLGLEVGTEITMPDVHLDGFGQIGKDSFSASCAIEFGCGPHMASFHFHAQFFPRLLAGLPPSLATAFTNAVNQPPFIACGDLMIVADIHTVIGKEVFKRSGAGFVPLIIKDVKAARYDPSPRTDLQGKIPPGIYRLSTAAAIMSRHRYN